ncbi:MAG: DUF2283 domain-containing protein [Planctomycetes bacterium]|nr:DUF2283 domain-containing protein [Planctomycetota bacterium]
MATVKEGPTQDLVGNCLALAARVTKLPTQHVWLDYDKEANVLYISFRRPQRATRTVEVGDDVLARKDGSDIVGLTILDASTRQ